MSTTATRPAPDTRVRATDLAGRPGVAMGRLVHVELRKMVDTRAGRWLLIGIAAVCALVVTLVLIWGETGDVTYASLFGLTTFPLILLLPIMGIMTATSEWSQRTGLVTFTLEPHRGRVILAKAVASVLLGLVLVAAAFVVAAVGHLAGVVALDLPGSWALGWSLVLLVSALDGVAQWLDLSLVTEPLLAGTMQASDWMHLGTSALLWVGVPLAAGSWRVLTREVK